MMAVRKTVCALTVLMLVMSSMTMVAFAAPAPPGLSAAVRVECRAVSFKSLGLCEPLLRAVDERGYRDRLQAVVGE